MRCDVALRDPKISPAARAYLEGKIARLDRLDHHLESAHAFLSTEREKKKVELVVSIERHGTVVVETRHENVFAAIDLAVDRMERQLAKEKEKRIERGRRVRKSRPPPER